MAGFGQWWVKTATPNVPMFTDDTGVDIQLGRIVQVVNVVNGTTDTGTITFPSDGTIPAITEGDEYMTLTITPTNTNNKLLIQATGVFRNSAAGNVSFGMALFQDSTTDALAAINDIRTVNWDRIMTLTHFMAAGTTSATTFRIRAGGANVGTTTFNNADFGNITVSSITITEIAA